MDSASAIPTKTNALARILHLLTVARWDVNELRTVAAGGERADPVPIDHRSAPACTPTRSPEPVGQRERTPREVASCADSSWTSSDADALRRIYEDLVTMRYIG
jgi:hypothetical protein